MPLLLMKFKYTGAGESTAAFGLTFPKGEPVEATKPYAVAKLQNHPLFEADNDNRTVSAESVIKAESVGQGRNRAGRSAKRK